MWAWIVITGVWFVAVVAVLAISEVRAERRQR